MFRFSLYEIQLLRVFGARGKTRESTCKPQEALLDTQSAPLDPPDSQFCPIQISYKDVRMFVAGIGPPNCSLLSHHHRYLIPRIFPCSCLLSSSVPGWTRLLPMVSSIPAANVCPLYRSDTDRRSDIYSCTLNRTALGWWLACIGNSQYLCPRHIRC